MTDVVEHQNGKNNVLNHLKNKPDRLLYRLFDLQELFHCILPFLLALVSACYRSHMALVHSLVMCDATHRNSAGQYVAVYQPTWFSSQVVRKIKPVYTGFIFGVLLLVAFVVYVAGILSNREHVQKNIRIHITGVILYTLYNTYMIIYIANGHSFISEAEACVEQDLISTLKQLTSEWRSILWIFKCFSWPGVSSYILKLG